jgi:hypothetical protein
MDHYCGKMPARIQYLRQAIDSGDALPAALHPL